ncbi:UV-stimulated scaffold protein A-like isoform X1 [Schistocerca americana]|uniref:UV-stimulated scaffold protein A-like isoform X1 n=1 Tax=Schistocerca americana TaxID=7009 RepID=UPI001F4F5246|nr:UV-stimulated scaffold protein A-like isoform X1 [Schistocerca americana]XP_046995661.1 UV-stimulated scaffold protein A-like isoform X1 [Schistocerca americana]XP_049958367.1 UV-stimulated scaffold protein A-like isoform X1 [Schistocerca serialis cubense]XP_049958369.1 UV-stimulated scaffold protein A-like isoform X1 [Schistocerca serialis cubense]XP_049958370.1 UV-stimulated scaffold protein A-like isoform X1 [Schistocerca serialis cubense]
MAERLDSDMCGQLAENVEILTHSGQKTLDESKLKKIKQICKSLYLLNCSGLCTTDFMKEFFKLSYETVIRMPNSLNSCLQGDRGLSNGYVKHTYHLLLCQLEKQHSEVRFSAFQICDVLFRRSHCFRELLVSEMQRVLELAAETNPDKPLPMPKTVAKDLKLFALRTIQQWNKEFGSGYKKLQLGFNFLKNCKKVDFDTLEAQSNAERLRQEEEERRKNVQSNKKLKAVAQEYSDMKTDISDTITALDNCISLILPEPENFFINEDKETDSSFALAPQESIKNSDLKKPILPQNYTDEEGCYNNEHRAHGLLSGNYKIEVELKPDIVINETSENAAIFENAKGFWQLINNRYLPAVKNWIKVITKYSGSTQHLKEIIDLKQRLEAVLNKWSELKTNLKSVSDTDESDSDLEEVEEKEGYEETVKDQTLSELNFELKNDVKSTVTISKRKAGDWNILQEDYEEDPTTAKSTLVTLNKATGNTMLAGKPQANKKKKSGTIQDAKPCTSTSKDNAQSVTSYDVTQPSTSGGATESQSRKQRLLEVAPKLPFDVDLYHWEDENVAVPTMFCVKPDGARFWSATSTDELEEIPVPEGAATLRTRVIEFTGKYEPVKWACRAPLPTGKLCPRRDRYKCPFHGPIVPRDEKGQRTDGQPDEKSEANTDDTNKNVPDWQDPQLLEDIKEATGIDLKMPEKRKKQSTKKERKKKFPGLTDISEKRKSSYERLSRKIFKKSSMKKVAKALDQLDHKRFRDKYGDQFHYMYGTA